MKILFLLLFSNFYLAFGEIDCGPAVELFHKHGVPSSHTNKSYLNETTICGAGPCCTANVEESFLGISRALMQEKIDRQIVAFLHSVSATKLDLAESLTKLLSSSEKRCLDTLHRLYPRLAVEGRAPITKLFAALRASLYRMNRSKRNSVDVALATFWSDLFPLVYQKSVHSNLDPFTHSYRECLKASSSHISPWSVIPAAIQDSMVKALNTARLLLHTLTVAADVLKESTKYQVPTECEAPATRLYFCAVCQASVALPCSGLCLNVARGCVAPLAELDGSWSELGTAISRIEESLKTSGLVTLLRDFSERVSDTIMLSLESGSRIQKSVRNNCGPHEHSARTEEKVHEDQYSVMHINLTETRLNDGSDFDLLGPTFELRTAESVAILAASKNFWLEIADVICADLNSKDADCWNGYEVTLYSQPAASIGVSGQKYNPEVKSLHAEYSSFINKLIDKIRAVKRIVTMELHWLPESDSYKRDEYYEEGSGYEPERKKRPKEEKRPLIDDEEDDDDLESGSGDVPDDNSVKDERRQEESEESSANRSKISICAFHIVISIYFLMPF